MQDGYFVIDSITHAFDMREENFASPRYAGAINGLLQAIYATAPAGYGLDPAATVRDWTVEETANILFRTIDPSSTPISLIPPSPSTSKFARLAAARTSATVCA